MAEVNLTNILAAAGTLRGYAAGPGLMDGYPLKGFVEIFDSHLNADFTGKVIKLRVRFRYREPDSPLLSLDDTVTWLLFGNSRVLQHLELAPGLALQASTHAFFIELAPV